MSTIVSHRFRRGLPGEFETACLGSYRIRPQIADCISEYPMLDESMRTIQYFRKFVLIRFAPSDSDIQNWTRTRGLGPEMSQVYLTLNIAEIRQFSCDAKSLLSF
jgi:hypothetical protein